MKKKSKFEPLVIKARNRFPGASLIRLSEIVGCSKKTVWTVLTAHGIYTVGDNWGGPRSPYKKLTPDKPKKQPICTCCGQMEKRADLRFLCDTCFREETSEVDEANLPKIYGGYAETKN